MAYSKAKLKNNGDKALPCFKTFLILIYLGERLLLLIFVKLIMIIIGNKICCVRIVVSSSDIFCVYVCGYLFYKFSLTFHCCPCYWSFNCCVSIAIIKNKLDYGAESAFTLT
jgi:hypothetical protein